MKKKIQCFRSISLKKFCFSFSKKFHSFSHTERTGKKDTRKKGPNDVRHGSVSELLSKIAREQYLGFTNLNHDFERIELNTRNLANLTPVFWYELKFRFFLLKKRLGELNYRIKQANLTHD